MSQNKLKEFIKKLVKEYTGTGASGGNAGDGNNIASPRPFPDDRSEIENYILKNVYGAEGNHYSKDSSGIINHNSLNHQGMFELKNYIKKVLEEIESDDYGDATLTTQGQSIHKSLGVWQEDIKEQSSKAEQQTYQRGLKRLQKQVLRYQLRWIEKQRSSALSQSAVASSQASKGFDDQIAALVDQIRAIDNPPKTGDKKQQKESLLQEYIDERRDINLMSYMDTYKRGILLEGTMNKLFKLFRQGKTNDEVLRHYAEKGIAIPDQFISKTRKQYESLKKLKLELDFSEQESKDIFTIPKKAEDPILFDLGDDEEEKQFSSRLYNEDKKRTKKNKINIDTDEVEVLDDVDNVDSVTINIKEANKKYPIPPEIKDVLEKDLKMYPLIRFVQNLKAVNSIPPSYRVFLLSGQHFDIVYEEYSLMVKIGTKEYYLADLDGRNYAIKDINKLLKTKPMKTGEDEEGEDFEIPTGGGGGGTAPPPTPEPEEEPEEPEEEPEA